MQQVLSLAITGKGGRLGGLPEIFCPSLAPQTALDQEKSVLSVLQILLQGPPKAGLSDRLPEEPAATCFWHLPDVLAAPRGIELTGLFPDVLFHGLNPLAVKKRRGRFIELGISSCL